MIDLFSLALSHGLMALVAWRLIYRPDLDREDAPTASGEEKPFEGFVPRA